MSARPARLLLCFVALLASCTTSDADRIDDFVKAVSGDITTARIQHVLDTYVDVRLQSLDVSVFGDARGYGAEQAQELAQDAHARLTFLQGKRLNVLRRHSDLKGSEARVELQLFGREGIGSVRFTLTKHGERWLMGQIGVSR